MYHRGSINEVVKKYDTALICDFRGGCHDNKDLTSLLFRLI